MAEASLMRPARLLALCAAASLVVGSAWATAPAPAQLTDAAAAPAAAPAAAVAAPLWIDVRTPGEYAQGHLEGAINVPLDVIARQIARHAPDKSAPIALYCRSGRRSAMAQDILLELGYTNVTNKGGYDDLVRRGVKAR